MSIHDALADLQRLADGVREVDAPGVAVVHCIGANGTPCGRYATANDAAKKWAHEYHAELLAYRYTCPECGMLKLLAADRADKAKREAAELERKFATPARSEKPSDDWTAWTSSTPGVTVAIDSAASVDADARREASYEAALQRWLTYERELALNPPSLRSIGDANLPEPPPFMRTVVVPRESTLRFRANYTLLENFVAEVTGVHVDDLTSLHLAGHRLQKITLEDD